MKRMCSISKLRPECVQAYREYHDTIWPELLDAYREAGIRSISCFLKDCDLVVYSEYDETIYEAKKAWLSGLEISKRWSELMTGFQYMEHNKGLLEEVFRMDK